MFRNPGRRLMIVSVFVIAAFAFASLTSQATARLRNIGINGSVLN